MATDADLERRLRGALLEHAHPDGLPDRVLLDSLSLGRTSVRRRRRVAAAGVAASLAAVAGLAVVVAQQDPKDVQPAPAPSRTDRTASSWAASLPQGASAEVPYLTGMDVVEPDGSRVTVTGTEASVVGQSVAGLVLLVGTEVQSPYSFTSRYVVVRPTGQVQDLPVSTLVGDGAQEALVSPDGQEFTNGGDILDMGDLSVVGHVPDEADILIAWTPVGIVYFVDGGDYVLWPEGGTPITLQSNPGVFATGSDVSIDMCGTVKQLAADGTLHRLSGDCFLGAWSVSPSGRWVLKASWELVEVDTGDGRDLTDGAVTNADASAKVWWDGDDSVLFPAGDWLVRCDVETAACERAAGPEASMSLP